MKFNKFYHNFTFKLEYLRTVSHNYNYSYDTIQLIKNIKTIWTILQYNWVQAWVAARDDANTQLDLQ